MSYASFGSAFGDTGVLPALQQVFASGTIKVGNLNFISPASKPLMGPALMPTTFVQDNTNSSDVTVMGNILFAPDSGEGTLVTMNRFLDRGYAMMVQSPTDVQVGAMPLVYFTKISALIAGKAQDGGGFIIIDGPAALLAAADAAAAVVPPAPPDAQCPVGTTGTWPNCVPIAKPPPGQPPPGQPPPGQPPPGQPPPGIPPGPVILPGKQDTPFLAAMGGGGLLVGLGIAVALVLMVKGSSKPKYAANRRRRSR
jgi:hypothetical protein